MAIDIWQADALDVRRLSSIAEEICTAQGIEVPQVPLGCLYPADTASQAIYMGCMCFQLKDGLSAWGAKHPTRGTGICPSEGPGSIVPVEPDRQAFTQTADRCVPDGLRSLQWDDAGHPFGSREALLALDWKKRRDNALVDSVYICNDYRVELPNGSPQLLYPLERVMDAAFAGCMCFQLKDGTAVWGDLHPKYGKK